uniref:DUF6598 domain-containing protein n=1 Tax=Triticum urartu TaxID=4572 RepID=A0A8R7TK80_TRIUA
MEQSKIIDTLETYQDICYMPIISGSGHRDGAIYKRAAYWEHNFFFDITDRTETRLEPTRAYEMPRNVMQIFSMKLAKAPINSGSIHLYGHIAAHDEVDLRLNYVFNRSRDDPFIVQQGSLNEMNGPKRTILLIFDVLLEFDMRIKNGENEEDDLQLIDGISEFDGLLMSWRPHCWKLWCS